MADDRRDEEQEHKITVRDRRRVTTEGELREVPEPTAPEATDEAAPAASGPRLVDDEAAAPRAEQARPAAAEMPHLRDVSGLADADDDEPEDEGPAGGDGMPQIRNVVDYLTHVTAEMSIWALSSLGLMPNPLTGLIAADMDQAEFAVESAEAMIRLLAGKLDSQEQLGLTQSFIMQFASVAAQLLQQPPQVRLQQIQKIRFCIDASDRFLRLMGESEQAGELAAELTRVLGELKLRFLQASGGGGIIG